MAVPLAKLAGQASEEAVALARSILERDVADRLWADQVGPALSQQDVARLLGKSEQAVSKDHRLVRLRTAEGRPVYPVAQFDGRGVLPGVAEVVAVLGPVAATPWTVAAWLTGSHAALDGRRPVDALRSGDEAAVAGAARRFAARLAR